MRTMKCPNCGGDFIPQLEGNYVCDHCGIISEGAGSDLKEEDVINLDNANYRRDQYDFEEALSLCQRVLAENPMNAEANRCALLARYKIVYLKNSKGEYTATFLDPEAETPITKSPYYRNLPERLKRELDKVEAIRQRVIRNPKKIPQYDVFISYKSGGEEAEWAKECYRMLAKQQEGKRYNVFYDEASLGARQAGWEPHIYAALKSAKCMILFASSLENLNSVWVQNEWKRFIYLQRSDPQKEIIVVGKNINPYDLPDPAMRDEQMLTVGEDQWQNYVKPRVREICDDSNIPELLKNGDSYILIGKFKKARGVFRRVLGLDPNCAAAYWGLLRCKLKAFDDYDIVKCRKRLDKIDEFYKARTLAEAENDEALIQRIRNVQNAQIAKAVSDFDRANYHNYRNRTKGRRRFKHFLVVVCVLAVVAAGAFGSWEYLHPLKYSVKDDQATLSGTGAFFRLITPEDLNIEKYNDCPIVMIGDGAFANAKFKTVKLASSVKTIGNDAFAGNKHLTKVMCLSTKVTIGNNAFANCVNLSSIGFGNAASETARTATGASHGTISIGDGAFENCISLESITLNGLTHLGANAFRGCTGLKEVYINSGSNLEIGIGAFDNVSETLTVRIPSVEEDLYRALVREYENITFEIYTRDRVEEVCYFIGKIGDVSLDSLPAIEKAERLYNALAPEEQGRVTNYGDLRDARAIYTAVAAIDHIGTVTLQKEADIKAAENVFNALNEMQKEKVSNRQSLGDARAVFNTMMRISEIGSVSLQSKSAIEVAEAAYDALTEAQKGMVSNYSVLRDARDTYDVILVTDFINRIGAVSENSGSLIDQAERAYNALSSVLRIRVTNYSLLQEARLVYNAITAIAKLNLITTDSASDISTAENLYYALTEEQQAKVTNRSGLESARKIYTVVEMIARIGQISLENESVITQAENAFDTLTVAEQQRVGNQSELKDARAAYDVMEIIASIGSVSAANRSKIEEAQMAYDSLTAAQRKKVGNYDILQNAVDNLKILDVETLINGIGQVTLSSGEAIEAAESAYQSLTSAQKERVSNHSVLLDARHIFDLMIVIGDLGSVTVGMGNQYNYDTLTSGSASKLNQSAFRNSIDSLTFSGVTKILESVWMAAFTNLNMVRYDLTSASVPEGFIVPNGQLTYVLVGDTSKKYNMKITAQAGTAVHVGFDNFVLEYGTLPIDLTNANQSYVSFYGNCSVTATDSGAGAIKAKDCTLTLENANVTVRAANGASGSVGGTAVIMETLMFFSNTSATLAIHGGNGGTGDNGTDVTISNNDYSNSPGNGKNGANGGIGIICSTLMVDSAATIEVFGGNGGKGGNGGNVNGSSNSEGQPKLPAGGNGGKGGDGGEPIQTGEVLIRRCYSLEMRYGDGGKGGDGGHGGDAYETTDVRPDNGGNGGHGGLGGNGFCSGDGGKGGDGGHSFGAKGGFLGTSQYRGTSGNAGNGGDSGTSFSSWKYFNGEGQMVNGNVGMAGKAGAVGTTDNNPGAVSGYSGSPGKDGSAGSKDDSFFYTFSSLVS